MPLTEHHVVAHADDPHVPEGYRVRWVYDEEEYDPGDTIYCEKHAGAAEGWNRCDECDDRLAEVNADVRRHGVLGCIVEKRTRRAVLDVYLDESENPTTYAEAVAILGECGDLDTRKVDIRDEWEDVGSLWSIVGSDEYHAEVTREMVREYAND